MPHSDPSLAVVERFTGAIERGDLDALNACFAAEAGIWHNTDQLWTTKAENAAAAAAFFEAFTSRAYKIDRLEPLPGGALLLFVANLVKADGRTLDWPGCAIFEIEGDEIVRLKEYIDAASFAAAVG
jgi:ketosteroid isomerase-like protein